MFKPPVKPDTKVEMDHVIARLQLRQRSEDLLLLHFGDAAPPDPPAEELLLGDHHDSGGGQPETPRQLAHQERYSAIPSEQLCRKRALRNLQRQIVMFE